MQHEDDSKYVTINPFNLGDVLGILRRKFKTVIATTLIGVVIAIIVLFSIRPYFQKSFVLKPNVISPQETVIILDDLKTLLNSEDADAASALINVEPAVISSITSMTALVTDEHFVTVEFTSSTKEALITMIDKTSAYLEKHHFVVENLKREENLLDSTIATLEREAADLEALKDAIQKDPRMVSSYDLSSVPYHYDIPLQMVELQKQKQTALQKKQLLETPFEKVNNNQGNMNAHMVKPKKLNWLLLTLVISFIAGIFIAILSEKR